MRVRYLIWLSTKDGGSTRNASMIIFSEIITNYEEYKKGNSTDTIGIRISF